MATVGKKTVKIIFDCNRLSDGNVHRETVNIHGEEFSPQIVGNVHRETVRETTY